MRSYRRQPSGEGRGRRAVGDCEERRERRRIVGERRPGAGGCEERKRRRMGGRGGRGEKKRRGMRKGKVGKREGRWRWSSVTVEGDGRRRGGDRGADRPATLGRKEIMSKGILVIRGII